MVDEMVLKYFVYGLHLLLDKNVPLNTNIVLIRSYNYYVHPVYHFQPRQFYRGEGEEIALLPKQYY